MVNPLAGHVTFMCSTIRSTSDTLEAFMVHFHENRDLFVDNVEDTGDLVDSLERGVSSMVTNGPTLQTHLYPDLASYGDSTSFIATYGQTLVTMSGHAHRIMTDINDWVTVMDELVDDAGTGEPDKQVFRASGQHARLLHALADDVNFFLGKVALWHNTMARGAQVTILPNGRLSQVILG